MGTGDATAELHTILDLVRYAASRFNEAELVFGQGSDDAVDDASLLIRDRKSVV